MSKLKPSVCIRYILPDGKERTGAMRSVEVWQSHTHAPRITSVSVFGETGMHDIYGVPELDENTITPGAVHQEDMVLLAELTGCIA